MSARRTSRNWEFGTAVKFINITNISFILLIFFSILLDPIGSVYLYNDDPTATTVKEYTTDNNVTKNDFETVTYKRVVEFYHPYCHHCTKYKKEYVRLANEMKEYGIIFHAVSCDTHHDKCQKYSVDGYPSIYVISGNDWSKAKSFGPSTLKKESIMLALQNFTESNEEDKVEDVGRKQEEKEKTDQLMSKGENSQETKVKLSLYKWKDLIKEKITNQTKISILSKKSKDYQKFKESRLVVSSAGDDGGGATNVMKANRHGTEEYKERSHKIAMKLMNTTNFKDLKNQLDRIYSSKNESSSRDQVLNMFVKKIGKPKMIEKIPLVRNIIQLSEEEKLIWDASLAFLDGLRYGLYHNTTNELNTQQKQTLNDWLLLLKVSLPTEWYIHKTINGLYTDIDLIWQGKRQFIQVLDKYPFPRQKYTKSCNYENGFHCGFWKLLHTLSLGIAVHRGGINLIDSGLLLTTDNNIVKIFSPIDAANTIRDYISYFFECTDCSNHFVAHYDSCDNNRRCQLDKSVYTTDDEWKEVAKWIWDVHNDFNVRLINEKHDIDRKRKQRSILYNPGAGPGAANLEEELAVLWPSVDTCYDCFHLDGTYNENIIFLYLEYMYWPGYDLEETPTSLLSLVGDEYRESSRLTILLFVLSLLFFFIIRKTIITSSVGYAMIRAKRLRTILGSNKKIERAV